jgi:hypothetical protein
LESSKRIAPWSIIIFTLCLAVWLSGLGFIQGARADSPGGKPTNTPKPTSTATHTLVPSLTPTFTLSPTGTPLPAVYLPDVAKSGKARATLKAIPTGTLLSLDELSKTLQAPSTPSKQPLPAFWVYLLILFAVSAAVVVIVVINLLRHKNEDKE